MTSSFELAAAEQPHRLEAQPLLPELASSPPACELGTGPPTSLQCAFTDTNPVSCPSQNTGANMATSFRWLPLPA